MADDAELNGDDALLKQIIGGWFILTDGQGAVSKWSEPAELLFGKEAPDALDQLLVGDPHHHVPHHAESVKGSVRFGLLLDELDQRERVAAGLADDGADLAQDARRVAHRGGDAGAGDGVARRQQRGPQFFALLELCGHSR